MRTPLNVNITAPVARFLRARQARWMCNGIRVPNNINVTIVAPPCNMSRFAAIACHISPLEASFSASATSHRAPVKNSTEKAA